MLDRIAELMIFGLAPLAIGGFLLPAPGADGRTPARPADESGDPHAPPAAPSTGPNQPLIIGTKSRHP